MNDRERWWERVRYICADDIMMMMTPNFWLWNSEKHLLYIIIDFLQFVAAKFELNLTFVEPFIQLVLTKNIKII